LLISYLEDAHHERNVCRRIQCVLQDLGAYIGRGGNPLDEDEELTGELENEIDRMTRDLPPLTKFVLPGGDEGSSRAHLCRTMARDVERSYVALVKQTAGYELGECTLPYLNRLSDYFFTLARTLSSKEAFYEDYKE
jgi:cob(I)alamin adenosyltransferase